MDISDTARCWIAALVCIGFGIYFFWRARKSIKNKQAIYAKFPWPLSLLAPVVGGEVNVLILRIGGIILVIVGGALSIKNICDLILE